ncbi:MAG TPA: class I SAM-dependent methyltransferase [Armatimonadota bacterium]|nr:class I SAM-dependent methyltransferase [Armatimonadota bacterium]
MAWYEEKFASEDPLRFDLYAESEASRQAVDFIIEKLEIQPGARILDLCCGQGRHLIELVRRGYDGVGLDLSPYMLEKCRQAAAAENIEPCLVRADMRDINFTADFDAVINMWSSFGYLESEEEDQKVLDGVSRALKPGGRFLVDLINRDSLVRNYTERRWQENSRGDIILTDSQFDSVAGRDNAREITIRADGRRSESDHSMRIYTYRELEQMLDKAGLEIQSAWGGFDSSPFTLTSRRMLVVTAKTR